MHDDSDISLAGLDDDDIELLGYLLEEEGLAASDQPRIRPRAPDADLPLSFAQERVWFLDQWDPGSPAFNIPFAVRLKGPLVVEALQRSLDEIVGRHESLRTSFPAVDGRPSQQIAPRAELPMERVDLSGLPAAAQEAEVRRLIMAGAQVRFDLAHGPLLRAVLLRLSDTEHIFLLTIHHIVFDAWSVGLFLRELTMLYDAFARGEPSPLPPLPIQYADYAIWQREWLQGEVLEQQLAYWKRQLGGALPVLELPGDYPRPPVMSYQGAIYTHQLPATLSAGLHALGQAEGTTLFMTTFAAFQTLLYRYSGEEDIIVGSLIANRDFVDTEGLLGYFINTLLLRADLSGNPSFRQLLGRVREMMLEAYAHQTVPFEQLVEELRPQRDPGHTPLFQVMFILQNAPIPARAQHDLEVEFLRIDNKTSKFDLTLSITELPEGLRAVAEYNTDIFEERTIARMMGHYQALLESIVADPDRPIGALSMLGPDEREQLAAWSGSTAPFAEDACAHQLFEARAASAPDAPALVWEGQTLSYGELNARANRLAHHLRELGVGRDSCVGIYIERSPELIVGLLGILKAGGAYVPLDPNYPRERLAFMIADSRLELLLTASGVGQAADGRQALLDAAGPGCAVVDLSTDWEQIAARPASDPALPADPHQLAYVIYTSGSSGQPKGVLIEHRSLVSYAQMACAAYAIEPGDRVLQFASINFDASAEEIYTALIGGATLVLRNERMVETIDGFLATCRDWGISVLSLPTAYWHELVVRLAADGLALPESLRLLIIGGERALPERVALWQQHVGGRVRLLNTYGPTETTVVATVYEVPPAPEPGRMREVPIGRPLPNLRAYVLDRELNPVPAGVPGELCIGGAGLARGYLNRPELTAERFVSVGGERLYRTGDLVRWRADGELEFLGRIDQQVKIRGFRVELGEVEAALRQSPAVADAVVTAREDTPGDRRLVAYVVPREQAQADGAANLSGELRAWLRERLPDYMLPAAYVSLERLPLTASGKINLRGLPAPDLGRPDLAESYVAPRTPVEEQVAALWASVLRVERVGVYDNFFELGGHSLLATQLIARVRANFGVDLPLRHLFGAPTVAGVAETIETIRWAARGAAAPAEDLDESVEEGEL